MAAYNGHSHKTACAIWQALPAKTPDKPAAIHRARLSRWAKVWCIAPCYALDHPRRIADWKRAVAECGRFAEQAAVWLQAPDLSIARNL